MRSRDPCDELLGLSRKASADEIRRAYRELVREYHPDANPDDPAGRRRAFQRAMPSLRDTLQPNEEVKL
jgi:curved DNA-binding protein CbpA